MSAKEKELIELRIKLMNADRFIKVHNDPMAAQQVIANCMQQVNNMLEACEGENQPDAESKCNKQSVNGCFLMLKDWFRESNDGNEGTILMTKCPNCGDAVVYNDGCVKCDAVFEFK